MSKLTLSFGCLVLLLLSACGFHLRGDVQVDPAYSPLMIDAAELTVRQQDMLRQALMRASAIVVDDAQSSYRLEVRVGEPSARKIARSNISAVTLMQLSMTLQYRLFDASGKQTGALRTLTQGMEMERDDDNLLGHQQQLDRAWQRLFRQLLNQLISQLSPAP